MLMMLIRKDEVPHELAEWLEKSRVEVGSKFYDINPFAEVFSFREGIYSLYTESADGRGDVWIHIVDGPEKAFVLDTSFGIGNLKGLINELTGGKELIVANTHPHLDHAYGNCGFDKVYCHEFCAPMLEIQKDPKVWDDLMDENGNGIYMQFKREDVIPYKDYEVVPCPNHHIFDLGGGHEIELIWMPGHAPGGAVYLDKKNRILFGGDNFVLGLIMIGVSPLPRITRVYRNEYISVKPFRDEMVDLVKRLDEFDVVYPQHGILEVNKQIVPDMFELASRIVADPNSEDYSFHNVHGNLVKAKRIGLAGIQYVNERVDVGI